MSIALSQTLLALTVGLTVGALYFTWLRHSVVQLVVANANRMRFVIAAAARFCMVGLLLAVVLSADVKPAFVLAGVLGFAISRYLLARRPSHKT